jgi:flagellar hook-length control protein FliK
VRASATSRIASPANIHASQAKPDANKTDEASPFALLVDCAAAATKPAKKSTQESGDKQDDKQDDKPVARQDAKADAGAQAAAQTPARPTGKNIQDSRDKQDDAPDALAQAAAQVPVKSSGKADKTDKTGKGDGKTDTKTADQTDATPPLTAQLQLVDVQTLPIVQTPAALQPAITVTAAADSSGDVEITAASAAGGISAAQNTQDIQDNRAAALAAPSQAGAPVAAQSAQDKQDATSQTAASQATTSQGSATQAAASQTDASQSAAPQAAAPQADQSDTVTSDDKSKDSEAVANTADTAKLDAAKTAPAKAAKPAAAKTQTGDVSKSDAGQTANNNSADTKAADNKIADTADIKAAAAQSDKNAAVDAPEPKPAFQPVQAAAGNMPAASAAQQSQAAPVFTQHVQVTAQPTPNMPTLAVAIAARSQSGARQFDIRLDPPELGRVDVRLSIDAAGKTSAHLSADQPQTLDLLQKDASSLTRALRDAGLDVSQDGLNFSLRQQSHDGGAGDRSNGRGTSRAFSLTATAAIDASPTSASWRGAADGRLDIRV